jgi:hypothetical protein
MVLSGINAKKARQGVVSGRNLSSISAKEIHTFPMFEFTRVNTYKYKIPTTEF